MADDAQRHAGEAVLTLPRMPSVSEPGACAAGNKGRVDTTHQVTNPRITLDGDTAGDPAAIFGR